MNFIFYDIDTGQVTEWRHHSGVNTVEEMLVAIYGNAVPESIGCIETTEICLPDGKMVDDGELIDIPPPPPPPPEA